MPDISTGRYEVGDDVGEAGSFLCCGALAIVRLYRSNSRCTKPSTLDLTPALSHHRVPRTTCNRYTEPVCRRSVKKCAEHFHIIIRSQMPVPVSRRWSRRPSKCRLLYAVKSS
ncbi:hypothetical protein EVAR_65135_1 [Eumeta japonica]|uniref:Uncharacterized protein n=1 Tax=Eumeta variegata TaxID=151549 RepID=A0A4C1Z996_EUMVA|nr:hypothetical protein EVAR_65135_1 [Eumeta japonica]